MVFLFILAQKISVLSSASIVLNTVYPPPQTLLHFHICSYRMVPKDDLEVIFTEDPKKSEGLLLLNQVRFKLSGENLSMPFLSSA